MTPAALLFGYSFELPLADALDDPELPPVKRALAAASIGTALDDGHLAAAELARAARQLATDRQAGVPDGVGEGAAEVRRILRSPGDDYQRALWYAVSRCTPEDAAEHLSWLAELMHARAAMVRTLSACGAYMPLLPRGHADDPDSAQLGLE